MTAIQQHSPYTTFINYFAAEPDNAHQLADMLSTATAEVNYAQWENTEAFEAMLKNETAREHMGKCAQLATSFEPRSYTVESVDLNLVRRKVKG